MDVDEEPGIEQIQTNLNQIESDTVKQVRWIGMTPNNNKFYFIYSYKNFW